MANELQNKTIWITGASSGIGRALAEQLAAEGANLVLSARNTAKLEALCADLSGQHTVYAIDLSDPQQALERAQALLESNGPVDILINNAGVSQRSEFLCISI